MAGAANQAGDADSSRAPGLTSRLQGSVNVQPWCSIVGSTVTVHQFFCILHIVLKRAVNTCTCDFII